MKSRSRWVHVVSSAVVIVALLALVFSSTVLAAEPVTAPASGSSVYGLFTCTHLVRFGESLGAIAARYRTTVFALMRDNFVANPNLIFAGMPLRVPCAPVVYCTQASYVVRPGDNLLRIGLRFGVNYFALARFNALRNPNLIFAGMRLAVPCSRGYAPPAAPGYPSPYPQPTPGPGGGTPPPSGGQTVSASIQDFSFSPNPINVRVGQMVVWRNNGPSPHTTTSDSGAWNSGTLSPGAMFTFTFSSAGTFTYHCNIHPSMHGTVVVTP